MKDTTHNNLIIITLILLILVAIGLVFAMGNDYSVKMEKSCKVIEAKTDLTYIGWSISPCGEGIDCLYTCKFVDKNGNIIYKHIK